MSAISAVLIHVPDWKAGVDWYGRAFPEAARVPSEGFGRLIYQGISIEIVAADEKVSAGPAGSVVYWQVENFTASLKHFLSIGGRLYRGPMEMEGDQKMCQVLDPWGSCIGLRGV